MSILYERSDYTRHRLGKALDGHATLAVTDHSAIVSPENVILYGRLNGWSFLAFFDTGNERLMFRVGCRYFTLREARKHWANRRNRYGEARGEIVDAVEAAAKIAKRRYGKTGR